MDPIEMEKSQVMKRGASKDHHLASLLQSSLKASLLGLILLSTSTWIHQVCSCLRSFFLVSLPYAASIAIAPKCLFVVSNIIVIFLVSESKLSRSTRETDHYDEYVARSDMLRRLASGEVKREEKEEEEEVQTLVQVIKEKDVEIVPESKEEQEDKEVVVHEGMGTGQCEERDVAVLAEENKEKVQEEQEMEEEEIERQCEEDEEEGSGLPAEELNRRVEDFIAKFNMERRLEARMLVCCC